MVLWLRFLTEIDEQTLEAAPELIADDNIKQALDLVEQSAYSEAQLEAYDKFWDAVRYENAKVFDAERNREEGIAEGILLVAKTMKQSGFSVADIIKATHLSEQEINSL